MQQSSLDQQFCQQFIHNLKLVVAACPQLMFGLKNIDSHTIYYSQTYADFLGIRLEHILGHKTVVPLYDNPQIEDVITAEDRQVIHQRQQLRLLKINKVAPGLKPYMCLKSPVINPETNNVVAILLQGLEISILNLNQLMLDAYPNFHHHNTQPTSLPNLSKRERQVIFLFMAQLTSQEIAEVIQRLESKTISKSTIDSIFNDQLYLKFKVNSRSALFEKLQQLNFDKLIPSEVLTSMSVPLATIQSF